MEPEPGHEHLLGRLSLPYCTRSGIVSIKYRSLDDSEPKYYGTTGVKPKIYGVNALFEDSSHICIVEGEFDSIVLWRECGIPAVSVPGASSWLPHFSRLFAGYDVVRVLTDGDPPGESLGRRICDDLDNAIVIPMPSGQDVTDVFLKDGADGLRSRIGV